MDIERWDFTTQGGYRYVHRNAEGEEFAFNGTFHTVRENEFAVQTFEFEGVPDVVAIESHDASTTSATAAPASASTRPTRASRPATAWSPRDMEGGLREGYERLDAILAA